MAKTKLKNSQLPQIVQVLGKLSQATKIPTRLKWECTKLRRVIGPVFEQLSAAERDIIREFAKTDERGEIAPIVDNGKTVPNSWAFSDPSEVSLKSYQDKMKELFNVETDEISHQFFDLSDFDSTELSSLDLESIEFLLNVPKDEPVVDKLPE